MLIAGGFSWFHLIPSVSENTLLAPIHHHTYQFVGAWFACGVLIAAWVTVKATQPVRIAITLVLTPFVARFFQREPAPAAAE